MSNVKKVAQNTSILTIGSLANRFFETVSIILLASYLTPGDFGYYATIFAYFSFCGILIDLGANSILIRECARDEARSFELMRSGFTIGVFMSFVIIFASYIVLKHINYSEDVKNLFWYGVFAIIVSSRFKSFRKMFEVMFIVNFKVIYIAVFNVLDRLLFMVCLFLFIRYSQSLSWAVLFTVLVDSLGAVLLFGTYIKHFKFPRLAFNVSRLKFLLSESWPLLLTSSVNLINIQICILIMAGMVTSNIVTADDVGLFRIGSLIPAALSFIPIAFSTPIFPILSKKYTVNKEAFFNVYKIMLKYLMFIGFPIVCYLFIELEEIIELLIRLSLREDYLQSIPVAQILLFSQIFVFGFVGFNSGLLSSNNQRLDFFVILISAISNIILNLILIPRYGIQGAAYATLVSYGLYIITALFIPKIRAFSIEIIRSFFKPGLASAIMGIILYILDMNMWLSLAAGFTLYLALHFLLRGFNRQDYQFFYEIYPNKLAAWLINRSE